MTYRYADLAEYSWLMPEIIKHESDQAAALGPLLLSRFPDIHSVVDIGCGPGIYLLPFKDNYIEVYGIDGAPEAGQSLSPGEFELVDLRDPWTPPHEFDLALCVEVGEHLLPEHHSTLVETISRCAPIIFWSAAHPGQGGEGHYGEAPPEYWFGLFDQVGYSVDHVVTADLHTMIDHDWPYEHTHWLRWHSHILRRR